MPHLAHGLGDLGHVLEVLQLGGVADGVQVGHHALVGLGAERLEGVKCFDTNKMLRKLHLYIA